MILKYMAIPLTPLVFRKPNPFGYGGYAPSRYPLPLPSTISGMIRTAILEYLSKEKSFRMSDWDNFTRFLGDKDNYSDMDWVLIGPYIIEMKTNTVYYSSPLDLINVGGTVHIIKTSNLLQKIKALRRMLYDSFDDNYFTPIPIAYLPDFVKILREGKGEKIRGIRGRYFLRTDIMAKYLDNSPSLDNIELTEDNGFIELSTVAKKKSTPGVALDAMKKNVRFGLTEEGYLKGLYYIVEKIWYDKDWAIFFAIYTGSEEVGEVINNAIENQILRLGGEGGLVNIRKCDDTKILEEESKYVRSSGKLKLVLTSSAVMRGNSVFPTVKGLCGFMIVEDIISGWKIHINRRRRTIYGAGYGSVFYFENAEIDVLGRDYVEKEYSNIFGSALLGRW